MNKLLIDIRTIKEDRVTVVTVIVTDFEVHTLGMQQFKIDEFMTLDKCLTDIIVNSEKIEYRRDKWKEYIIQLLGELTI